MRVRLKPLDAQVIVITGASSGIGMVTAKRAAAAGAKVLLVARGEAALRTVVAEIAGAGGVADYAVADVDDPAQVEAAAAKAVARFGGIDTWVNNAGVAIYAPLRDTPDEAHRRMMRTNYFGAVHGCLAAIPHLEARGGGVLITVGSIAGDMAAPIMGAYAATKHAIKGYVGSLRIELEAARVPISVTLIKPSGIDTPVAEHALNLQDGEARIPPPVYDPDLVAKAILDAAVRPRREITVGGVGRAQVLFAEHFAPLFEKLAPLLIPLLVSRDQPKQPRDALDGPIQEARERGRLEHGRPLSAYTETQLHPKAALGALAAVAALGVAGALLSRRERQ